MRGIRVAAALWVALSGAAQAEDKPAAGPAIGPAPDWVKPVALPADTANPDEAAIRILLSDQQVRLEPGRQTVYTDAAIKLQTPQGLAAGNISLPWRPDTDVLTVHKLRIRRGDQTIDVLASGQTFTVLRREQNLESAMLDGVLTANIQPEGLQVGDILEFAYSLTSSDPVLKGHVEELAASWNGIPIGRAHLRMEWPSTLPVRLRQTPTLPALKPVKAAGTTAVELSLDNVAPLTAPKGAPVRYQIMRLVEATDFPSWAEPGALMAPLYEKAAVVPATGALRTEFERIRDASSDPKARAQAALTLVQDRIRYVALVMGTGGYVPADAETTWARRYGDCKAKTALLLALLHGLGIEADPVAVSTVVGDGMDQRLPMIALFNHVLVRATIAGKTYWLDGTRTGDTSLDRLQVPLFGWGLPLVAKNAALVRILPPPLDEPNESTEIHIDARAGLTAPAPIKVETVMRGDAAVTINLGLANLAGEPRENALKEMWRNQYNFVDIKTVNAAFDAKTGEERMSMEGLATMAWKDGWYETDGTGVGYKADFTRDPGPGQDAPFAVPYPYYNRTRETILLPPGFTKANQQLKPDVNETVAGIEYRRHATLADDVFTIEKTERSTAAEFAAKDAPAAQAELRRLADQNVYLRRPDAYRASAKEADAALATVPTTAAAFIDRGNILMTQRRYDEAIKDFDSALGLDAKNVWALADRGLTKVWKSDAAAAAKDLDAAAAIDPKNPVVWRARGLLAERARTFKQAVAAYTISLETDPDNDFAITRRAFAYAAAGDDEHALVDTEAALKRTPGATEIYALRAGLLIKRGEKDRAIAEAKAAAAADPGNADLHVGAGRIYFMTDKRTEAIAEYDKALAIRPNAAVYAERSRIRLSSDFGNRQADIDAALKLDPASKEALAAQVSLLQDKGDGRASIETLNRLVAAEPTNLDPLMQRAEAYRVLGDYERALADTDAALKLDARRPDIYLTRANLLRSTGRADEAVKQAAAVEAADPNETYAHVIAANIYATFKKQDEAMQAYDRALAIKAEPYIYLNRSRMRPKADVAGRRADLDAALKLDPDNEEALNAQAALQMDAGDFAAAIATYSAALNKKSDDVGLLAGRGVAYARAGDSANAQKDFDLARARALDPTSLNNMCWNKATAGVALEAALADCNAALGKAPEVAGFLDSRGLVLLRLGRYDDAIADYDKALAKYPAMAPSLFGRAVARARKGDKAKADADMAAALKIDPDVRTDFEGYGVKL